GKGTEIWHFSHVQEGAFIGDDCFLGHGVNIGRRVKIGNDCKIQGNVTINEGITLEEGVYLGASMVFTNDRVPRARTSKGPAVYRETIIHEGATVGANATIVCGNHIGRFAMVAAGAVVLKSVPNYALVAGVPAKKIGWVCQCGEILPYGLECTACGKKYKEENGELIEC
ncbi:MAG: acyltransferase, partial [Anaerovoracaceae bacterium]